MPIERNSFRVLLRIAAELIQRSARVKRYLEQVGQGDTGEYRHLSQTITTALDGIASLLPKEVTAAHSAVDASDGEQVFLAYRRRFSEYFTKIHELLVYLPRQPVAPETVSVLETAFGPAFRQHAPSILLGVMFNAAEFDFYQILSQRLPDLNDIVLERGRAIVLELAVCDRECPATWAVLGHELGHTIDVDR